jgi:mono/diheme cytochrome c family protein
MEKSYAFAAKQVALWAIFLCFSIFLMMIYPILQTPKLAEMPFVCGNAAMPTFDGEEAKNGKLLFITNCAQCHAKNMKDDLNGPALGGWRNYFSNEKEVQLYLNNPKKYIRRTKNKHLKRLIKEFEPAQCMPFPTLTEDDVASIVKYIDVVHR